MSRTLSGLFLVGAVNRLRKRKRTNRESPRRVPGQIGKIQGKSGKVPKEDKKGQRRKDKSRSGTPPPLNFQSRLKFSISIEIFNLAWNFQSWPSEFPTEYSGLVGSSLEIFNLAWKIQSRMAILIFSIFAPLGHSSVVLRPPLSPRLGPPLTNLAWKTPDWRTLPQNLLRNLLRVACVVARPLWRAPKV